MFLGAWYFCAEFFADRLGLPQKRSCGGRLALFSLSLALALGAAIILIVVLTALIMLGKAILL